MNTDPDVCLPVFHAHSKCHPLLTADTLHVAHTSSCGVVKVFYMGIDNNVRAWCKTTLFYITSYNLVLHHSLIMACVE